MANPSVHKGSDFVKVYFCDACESKKSEQIGEFYCATCQKCFCVKCNNLHSQLYANHSIYGRGHMSEWPLTKKVEDFLQKCGIHKDKKLEMFCQDHSQLCCTKCVLLNHRQCTSVPHISEAFQNQNTNLNKLLNNINAILEELKKLHNSREASIQNVEVSYNERLHEVREVRQKLNAIIDVIEKATVKELDDLRTLLQASLKTDVDNCIRLEDDLKELSEAVQDLVGKSNVELSFIASQKGIDKTKQSEEFLKENCVKVESSLSFQANKDIEQYLFKQLGLGKIVQRAQSLEEQRNSNPVLTVKQNKVYDVVIPNDSTKISYITGICVISNDNILVASYKPKRVILLDKHYTVISYCDVSVSEGDICQISACEVAVTVAEGNTHGIQFISVNSGQLVKGRKLQLLHLCAGIAHHDGNLYVTSRTALYKYSLAGKLVKKLYEDLNGGITVWKCAVSPTGDKIYITDHDRHELITLTRDGTVLCVFTDPKLEYSWGVHVTPAGQVLVCGQFSQTIIQVDEKGSRKLDTLAKQKHGLRGPVSVCYNSNNHSVLVGQHNSNKLIVLEVI